MKKFFIAMFFTTSGLAASAQSAGPQPGATYAAEACRAGCAPFNTVNGNFYIGAAIKSFRVCTANGFAASINVDGTVQEIPGTKFDVRGCIDVSAQKLTLLHGEIAVGPLPG